MEFKDVLYNLRSKKGMSQAALAKALDMSPGLIGMYESGKRMPSVETHTLCTELNFLGLGETGVVFNNNVSDYGIGGLYGSYK